MSALELLSSRALSSARTLEFYHAKWARFRRAKRFFSTPSGRDSHAQMGAFSFDKNTKFTILDCPLITRYWINDLINGNKFTENAPDVWMKWVKENKYKALISPRSIAYRKKDEQIPSMFKAAR